MISDNFILRTDSYKFTHWKQYPVGTQEIYSYLESRSANANNVFFGLQYYLMKYLEGRVITSQDVRVAEKFVNQHIGKGVFNYRGWMHIANNCGGRIPVRIMAVPEGSVVPSSNALVSVWNTDPQVPWITNVIETLLMKVWYPITVATLSYSIKKLLWTYLKTTCKDPSPAMLDFMLHDFGYRGVSSEESAGIGDAGHLLSFKGTDTVAGLTMLMDYYGAANVPGFSVPAAEHSTITTWGYMEEKKAFRNMLKQFPEGIVSVVSDSWDIYNACENLWGGALKEEVKKRKGVLVIRPDSGDPLTVIERVFEILEDKFKEDMTVNEKGYRVLPPYLRVIQGDGVNKESISKICHRLMNTGWSVENIVFGMGGALLQQVNRDTYKFAFKTSNAIINNSDFEVYKQPKTMPEKNSKPGRVYLVYNKEAGRYQTVKHVPKFHYEPAMETVFEDGIIKKIQTVDEIRGRLDKDFEKIQT